MTWWQTLLLGVVGSFVGGFLGLRRSSGSTRTRASSSPGGIIFSLIGAIVALLIWRAIKSRRGGTRAA